MTEKCLECDICGKSIYNVYFIEDERQVIRKNNFEAACSALEYCSGVNTKSIVCPKCANKIHKFINSLKRGEC